MALNPHLTDQHIAALDNGLTFPGDAERELLDGITAVIADQLPRDLPGADPQTLGEIMIHAGSAMYGCAEFMGKHGYETGTLEYAAIALGRAGALLYRDTPPRET